MTTFTPPPVAEAVCDWPGPVDAMLALCPREGEINQRELFERMERRGYDRADSAAALKELLRDSLVEIVPRRDWMFPGVRRVEDRS